MRIRIYSRSSTIVSAIGSSELLYRYLDSVQYIYIYINSGCERGFLHMDGLPLVSNSVVSDTFGNYSKQNIKRRRILNRYTVLDNRSYQLIEPLWFEEYEPHCISLVAPLLVLCDVSSLLYLYFFSIHSSRRGFTTTRGSETLLEFTQTRKISWNISMDIMIRIPIFRLLIERQLFAYLFSEYRQLSDGTIFTWKVRTSSTGIGSFFWCWQQKHQQQLQSQHININHQILTILMNIYYNRCYDWFY